MRHIQALLLSLLLLLLLLLASWIWWLRHCWR
jgi:hypothetical protein